MKSRLIVSAIIEYKGKYLLGRKPKDIGPYPNTWHTIGGGVDPEQESIEEGLRREVREEAGIEITDLRRLTFDEDYTTDKKGQPVHYVFITYNAKALSNDVIAGDDIEQLRWFTKSEIKKLDMPKPSQNILKAGLFFK